MKTGSIQYSGLFQFISITRKTVIVITVSLVCMLLLAEGLHAQNTGLNDSIQSTVDKSEIDTASVKVHSSHKATLYSMILPGLGQAYNKKYWKIPIIYAGFGVFYYLIDYNNTEYQLWREAYYHTLLDPHGLEDPVNEYEELYGNNSDFLRDRKNDARRYRDLNYILAGVWYLLNVVDAAVDAHLFTWNMDEDLSLRVEPHLYSPVGSYKPVGGIKFSLRF